MAEHTELDTVYDPRAVEPRMYAKWEREGAFVSEPAGTPRERTFTVVIPPPNVTGALHLGHALNNTLQDILIRYHRMRGFNTLWQPGTDHAGIATQAVVERRIREQEGKSRHDLGREELVKRIWQWKEEYEKRIIGQLKLMGCSCDWDRTRFTLDDGLARAVRHQFFNLFKDGLIFRGKRLVNWDTELQTAVANDEVYYETVKGHFWHFKYPVIDPKSGEPEHVIIATTRPETMLGDTAVAVHPDPEAFFERRERQLREGLARASAKERAELESKLEGLLARRESHLTQLIQLRDMARDGRMLMLPLVEREIPLIRDEWADPTLGSGCVKITPAHDPNDYEVGLRHKRPMINVLSADGKVARISEVDGSTNAHSNAYEGLDFAGAGRNKVVADLEARGLLLEVEDHDTEIGHSDRSKTPIEPYLSDQWFVQVGDIREPRALARADTRTPSEPRASACADTRTPDLSQGAVLLTWTTYATWLPGDERGFVSRVERPGGSHELHNLPGEPYDADDPQTLASAQDRTVGQPVYLNAAHAEVVLTSIARTTERHGIELLAAAVMSNHVHVLCQSDRAGRELLQLLKGNLARELNLKFELGEAPRWWTKSGSERFIKPGADLTAAVEYVKSQSDALCVWSFDLDRGAVFDSCQSARAEAGGSLGITLGDGSKAPGLAQAAIDAVNDGQIQIFPTRYAKSYLDWLGEKRDWCISRQLWWGHRIPVWEFAGTTNVTAAQVLHRQMLQLSERGLLAWQASPDQGDSTKTMTGGGRFTGKVCYHPDVKQESIKDIESSGFVQDEDVLDTWFSSALWPFSTLGWPDDTEHLKQYYPTSVLITTRDIITNWVARMVMFGLYSMGKVPFDHVYIHPKILDGRGETMSKSKGNGVDPVDIIHTHGADALRYAMADLTTETQDIRMSVEYICPHCTKLVDQSAVLKAEQQSRKSRGEKLERKLQPADCRRVKCTHKDCAKEFATQWAGDADKKELPVARETSDKFDNGRNFCNKLWNAARFALMNLEGTPCEALDVASLGPEDRWILAQLSQTIRRYHELIQGYQFSASVKLLREFFWDSLCDWYIELTKPRMATEPRASARANNRVTEADSDSGTAKQVLAICIDQILRLFHPTMPFITEEIWDRLCKVVPKRGLPGIAELSADFLLARAQFPPEEGYPALDDAEILKVFAEIQEVVRAVRELRSQCDVSPKKAVEATVAMPEAECEAFKAHAHIVLRMANVSHLKVDPAAKRPPNAGSVTIGSLRVFVHDISDDDAERQRTTKTLAQLDKQITGKESKLSNEKFIANAKSEVVAAERKRLDDLHAQRKGLQAHLAELEG